MASAAGGMMAAPNHRVHGAPKAGVVGITKAIAADFRRRGIRCNAICPDTVVSPSFAHRLRKTGDHQAAKKTYFACQPIGHIGKPEEIAAQLVCLASDKNSYTTGGAHAIDGGWTNI